MLLDGNVSEVIYQNVDYWERQDNGVQETREVNYQLSKQSLAFFDTSVASSSKVVANKGVEDESEENEIEEKAEE
jgi:hypothetical protein